MEIFDAEGHSIFDQKPKRKKKYILFLFSHEKGDENRIHTIERAIQKTLADHVLVRFEDPDEGLKALLVKNIEIVLIDSSLFLDDKVSVEYAAECKKRRKCPILFIAHTPEILLKEYRKIMFAYEEFDDYFRDPVDFSEVSLKLSRIMQTPGRKAKRFSLNIPVTLYRLNDNIKYSVILSDISLVGFGLESLNKEIMFSMNEQIQIKIPLIKFKIFHPYYGEFLPISGKIRRISINSSNLGCSIEFTTSQQLEVLMEIIERVNYRLRMAKIIETPKAIRIETNKDEELESA